MSRFRNTRVIDIYRDLVEFGLDVTVYDPWVDQEEVKHEYGIKVYLIQLILEAKYSAIVLAVSHNDFLEMIVTIKIRTLQVFL